ncbi:MAG: hypothetical protein AVDCRST_MAG19-4165, partial [uncultured Thermomicrobiales bacterium]
GRRPRGPGHDARAVGHRRDRRRADRLPLGVRPAEVRQPWEGAGRRPRRDEVLPGVAAGRARAVRRVRRRRRLGRRARPAEPRGRDPRRGRGRPPPDVQRAHRHRRGQRRAARTVAGRRPVERARRRRQPPRPRGHRHEGRQRRLPLGGEGAPPGRLPAGGRRDRDGERRRGDVGGGDRPAQRPRPRLPRPADRDRRADQPPHRAGRDGLVLLQADGCGQEPPSRRPIPRRPPPARPAPPARRRRGGEGAHDHGRPLPPRPRLGTVPDAPTDAPGRGEPWPRLHPGRRLPRRDAAGVRGGLRRGGRSVVDVRRGHGGDRGGDRGRGPLRHLAAGAPAVDRVPRHPHGARAGRRAAGPPRRGRCRAGVPGRPRPGAGVRLHARSLRRQHHGRPRRDDPDLRARRPFVRSARDGRVRAGRAGDRGLQGLRRPHRRVVRRRRGV